MISSMPTITDTVDGPIPPRVDSDTWPGVLHTRPTDLAKQMGAPPWFTPVIVDERNQVTLIAGGPGHGNRPHWHEDFDEWWFILAGELQWELTGGRTLAARKGDIVWVPRGTTHHIQAVGDETSLRLAVAAHPGIHYYADCGVCGYVDDGPREYGHTERPPGGTVDVTDVVKGPIAPRMDNPSWPGVLLTRPAELISAKGPPPWQQRLIVDERNIATIMANLPGTGNRPHWHSDFDEWWVVLGGDMVWELTGGRVIEATGGDIVWVPRGTTHHIKNVGDEISLRVAVGMPPGIHYYHDCDVCGHSDDGPREWDVPLDAW